MVKSHYKDGVKMFYPAGAKEWRNWLIENHSKETAVWLIYYKPVSGKPRISYDDAVDEAICFGWIDSKPAKLDEERSLQYFTKRNPRSNWSTVNRKRALRLIREKRMAAAGLEAVAFAKRNGQWMALRETDSGIVPKDLLAALKKKSKAYRFFMAFPKSSKKNILEWIHNAKRPETRLARIKDTVLKAEQNIRANHFRQPKGASTK